MKKIIFLLLTINCPLLTVHAQTQFQRTIGGTNSERCYSMIQTTDGGYAMAGYTTAFGAGDYDCYVVKLDPGGALQWTRTFGGPGRDFAQSIIRTADGGYALACATSSFGLHYDFWILKLDGSGALQ